MNDSIAFREFEKNGYFHFENFLDESEVNELQEECSKLVQEMIPPEHCSVFHTGRDQARDEYFINSGDKISFFYEKDAVDKDGNLVVEKEKSLNKMGHALHWLNPVFKNLTFSNRVKDILKTMKMVDPVVVQSMVIFKHPQIGGIVTPHQDSTFLYTEPLSTIGIWIPLVDITMQNGCLWFIPGSHKGKIYQRYLRNPSGSPRLVITGEMPELENSLYTPVLAKKGDCIIIHGSVIHKSGLNTSNDSRPIYTFHVVEKSKEYSKDNWLQPTVSLPFPSVYLFDEK